MENDEGRHDKGEGSSDTKRVIEKETIEDEMIEAMEDEMIVNHGEKPEEVKECDASLDLPIALRKGTRSCTKYPMHSYMTYSNLTSEFKAFTTSLDTEVVPDNISVEMKKLEWWSAVMEEIRSLEKNKTWEPGYIQGHSDHTLFVRRSTSGKIDILIVYVDDIILSGDDDVEVTRLKTEMAREFEIKDLGKLRYFLGIERARSKEGISVSQQKYTLDLLKETGMIGCIPIDTPVECNTKISDKNDGIPVNKERYQ
ncbi:uncharacterized protein LOC120073491 [Benincasa hispida]|uniref:uncharacterized protein LOC120073491 n=1 Tax=Benincasa hispida TaxID=102211 RepID=UPI0019015183|nr:uncharacterized protein LOC120073491 [Benincasa hispida]